MDEPIAVLGVGCRLPGSANDPDALWRILVEGRDVVGPVPRDRWDLEGLYHPDYNAPGRIHQQHGGFVDHITEFDAAFFGMSPKEAGRVDPQHRLVLEAAHQALENAGIGPWSLGGSRTGVFVGISTHDYSDIQSAPREWSKIGPHTNQGGALSIAANRLSYMWNLHGPSVAIDTACSSTLYALHYALASLRSGDCELALVGGVNALLTAGPTIGFSKGSFLSARGRCQAFSAHADGFVRSEGAAVLVLKPLSQALSDDDPILAVIRQTAVNEDGRTDGMALPSEPAQIRLLEDAYRRAGIDPASVGYVEAHGTGTPAGDPIEARAIGTVLGRGRPADRPLLVGSIKTNIGHLEAGAGGASLLKAVLAIRHGYVPASLHSAELNPEIPFDALRLQVVREGRPWPAWDPQRRVGVNGFGFGGANAHAVLEAPPPPKPRRASQAGPVIGTLSARTPEALATLALAHLEHATRPGFDLTDVAHTTVRHRDHHPSRAAVVARDSDEWRTRLARLAKGEEDPGVITGRVRGEPGPVAFVCSGQGPQWWAMGRQLLASDPIVRGTMEAIDALFHSLGGWSILEALGRDEATSRIDETQIAQPALFALQMALARRWEALGLRPTAVVGHSVGEVAAAVLSGALTLEQGVRVILHRSRIQQKAHGKGRMLAVGLTWEELAPRVAAYGARVSPAAFNRPSLVVLSGDAKPLEALAEQLLKEEVFHRFVAVAVPFHSHHMEPLRAELNSALAQVRGVPSTACTLYSTVAGDRVDGPEFGGDYWYRNVREPVRFVQAIQAMLRDGIRAFVELSPHPILMPGLEELIALEGQGGIAVPSMRRDTDEESFLLQSAGRLYAAGYAIEPARSGKFVPVPNMPWERRPYWVETTSGRAERSGASPHPAVAQHRPSATDPTRHSFQLQFDPRVESWLKDHVVQGMLVVPGAALLEAALACARTAFGEHAYLAEVSIERALFAPSEDDADPPEVWLEVDGDDGRFRIVGREPGGSEWIRHVAGRIDHRGEPFPARDPELDAAARCRPVAGADRFYPALHERGLSFGPTFRTLEGVGGSASAARSESVARIVPHPAVGGSRHRLHPTILDAAFQALIGAALAVPGAELRVYLPVGMAAVRLPDRKPVGGLRARTIVHRLDERWLHGDVWLVDDEGNVVAEVQGFEGRALPAPPGVARADRFEVRWFPEERPDQWAGRNATEGTAPFATAQEAFLRAERESAADPVHARWESFETALHDYAEACIVEALRDLGVDLSAGARITLPLPGVKNHERMSRRMVTALVEAGFARRDGSGWVVVRPPPYVDLDAVEAALDADPQRTVELDVVIPPGRALADVLRGDRTATEVLFGPGSKLPEFYAEGQLFRAPLGLLAQALRTLAAGAPPDRVLRVLEVGAGTGGMTRQLLPALPADRTEYVYTDLSLGFMGDARERFAAWPFVRFGELDLERDTAAQGYAPGSFDVVACSDVLHATHDIRASLARAAALLAPGGVLLMLELTTAYLFGDVTFGLTDGWWAFEDVDLRPERATLSPPTWKRLLEDAGFDLVSIGHAAGEALTRQCVFMARKRPDAPRSAAAVPRAEGRVVIVGSGALATRVEAAFEKRGATVRTVDKVTDGIGDAEAVVYLTPAAESRDNPGDVVALHRRIGEPLRQAALGIARAGRSDPARLVIATRNAVAAQAGDTHVAVAPSVVLGLGRVIASELPQVPVRLVDLSAADDAEIESLVSETLTPGSDRDVALRGARRFVAGVDRTAPTAKPRPVDLSHESFTVRVGEPGVLDTLQLRHAPRREPGPGEVEVQVRATGLNFRDLMLAMGLLSSRAAVQAYGMEVSGVVARVGPGVSEFHVGDEVMAVGFDAFAGFVTTNAALVMRKPADISHAAAATVPIAFGTAWYCLVHQARLERGEHVLVHAATGGVGHAAIQIARLLGATVHATAGSDWKRAYLRDKLGVEHVYDSRSLAFVREVREATGGRGVDVILNSLSGAAIPRGIEALAHYGRFVEIGKTDIYDNRRLGLYPFRENLSLFAVDLERMSRERPDHLNRTTLSPIEEHLAHGRLRPLPHEAFHVTRTREAFQVMSRSRHIGKIVVEVDERTPVQAVVPQGNFAPRADRTWIVTGGTRGFGHRIARWLVDHGARSIALLGASGRLSDDAARNVEEWRAQGIAVRVAAVDAGNRAAVDAELRTIRATMAPIGGVVHAAMILDDAPIDQLGIERFAKVLGPKAGGALNLDELTRPDPVEQFVLIASVSELAGNPGQANYNAANALLVALAWNRRLRGLPGTVVHLGGVQDVGFVADRPGVMKALEAHGLVANRSDDLVDRLGDALRDGVVQRIVGDVDWPVTARALPAAAGLARRVNRADRDAARHDDLRAQLGALEVPERTARLVPVLRRLVARVVAAEPDAIGVDEPLTDLGLDSLMVNQIASWLQAELGVVIPTMRLLKGPTIQELAADVAGRMASGAAPAKAVEAAQRTSLLGIHKAIWADHEALQGSASMTMALRIEGPLDPSALERALRGVVTRHELLDSHYESGEVHSRAAGDFVIARTDASGWAPGDLHAAIASDALAPFDLSLERPIRATLYDRGDGLQVLDLRLHHVAFDAVTPLIVSQELAALYAAEVAGTSADLPPAPTLDAMVAHEQSLGADRARSLAWWKRRLAGSDLRVPLRRADRTARDHWLMQPADVPLDPGLGDGIRALAADAKATPFAVLATAWQLALRDLTGATDLVTGTSVSLRDRPELERFVGPAIQFVPLRTQLSGCRTFRDALAVVADATAGALEHRGVPLYDLVEELVPPARRAGRARLGLDTNFHLYDANGFAHPVDANGRRREEGAVVFSEYQVPGLAVVRPYDLTCRVWHATGRYTASLRYNPRVLDAEQAKTLAGSFASHVALAAAGYHRRP